MWVGGVANSQTRSKHLKTPPNHPENRLFQPEFHLSFSQISQKPWGGQTEKIINRDCIKGELRGGSPFSEVISQKIFNLNEDGFPQAVSKPLQGSFRSNVTTSILEFSLKTFHSHIYSTVIAEAFGQLNHTFHLQMDTS